MTKRFIAVFVLLAALGLSALTSTACAQSVASPDQNKTNQDKDKWQLRDGYEYRVYPLRPTQWPDGTATAPENCLLTPAKAKKYQCKTITYEGRPYYYFTGEQGSVYARRPVGAGVRASRRRSREQHASRGYHDSHACRLAQCAGSHGERQSRSKWRRPPTTRAGRIR